MSRAPDIVAFTTDPQLLGLSLSPAQETLLRAIYGLPMTAEQRAIYHACTGRTALPAGPFSEVTCLAGARSGKDSRIAAPVMIYEALFGGHEAHLHKGERGMIPLVAPDQRGTRIAFGYIKDYLLGSPLLAAQVAEVLASEIVLTSGLTVFCFPCTMAALRGWSNPAAVMDEVGFFRLEGAADSDIEIQTAVRRGMIGFPAPRLMKVSTPYMRSGVLYEDFTRGWGQDDPDLLVWKAPTALMNPSILEARLDQERRRDPTRFVREYEAEFVADLDAFLPAAWVDAAVVPGRHELAPRPGVVYVAAADTSGGGSDAFTFSLVHVEGTGADARIVQDVLRGWRRIGQQAPDLVAVVREIKATLTRYGLSQVIGDAYGAQWLLQECLRQGVAYSPTAPEKSVSYLDAEPYFAQGRVELLDHPQQARELKMLERRAPTSGRPKIDHPRGQHDDYANALARAVVRAVTGMLPADYDPAKATWFGPPLAAAHSPLGQPSPSTDYWIGAHDRTSAPWD